MRTVDIRLCCHDARPCVGVSIHERLCVTSDATPLSGRLCRREDCHVLVLHFEHFAARSVLDAIANDRFAGGPLSCAGVYLFTAVTDFSVIGVEFLLRKGGASPASIWLYQLSASWKNQ